MPSYINLKEKDQNKNFEYGSTFYLHNEPSSIFQEDIVNFNEISYNHESQRYESIDISKRYNEYINKVNDLKIKTFSDFENELNLFSITKIEGIDKEDFINKLNELKNLVKENILERNLYTENKEKVLLQEFIIDETTEMKAIIKLIELIGDIFKSFPNEYIDKDYVAGSLIYYVDKLNSLNYIELFLNYANENNLLIEPES